jgi:hypothetical protein
VVRKEGEDWEGHLHAAKIPFLPLLEKEAENDLL